MRKDIIATPQTAQESPQGLQSSFLSCSDDINRILDILFIQGQPYSDNLKKLLIIQHKDCLSATGKTAEEYQKQIDSKTLHDLRKEGYIKLSPKFKYNENETAKASILITCDGFSPSLAGEQYRDCNIAFDIICYLDKWELTNNQIRPLMICGYIDGILKAFSDKNKKMNKNDKIKLTGIGEYNFMGCTETVLSEDYAMYSLMYRGVHFTNSGVDESLSVNYE